LKVSLLSTEVWLDNERLGPMRTLDYVALYTRLRDGRGAKAGAHAASFELEVDATATTFQMLTLYWLSVHAGYRHAELITWAGRTTVCSIDCNTHPQVEENALDAVRTVLIVHGQGVSIWSGEPLSRDEAGSTPAPERLLDAPWKWKDDALEAGVRRACAGPPGCSRLTTYMDPYVASGQLKRLLAVLERMRGARDGGVVLELRNEAPPAPGDEGSTFRVSRSAESGRLPSQLISAVLSRHRDEIFRCTVHGKPRNRGWTKTDAWLTFDFVITEQGGVTDIGLRGGELHADVLGCAVKEIEAIRFPPPEGGAVPWRLGFPVYEWR
jgi:hypothetical protein